MLIIREVFTAKPGNASKLAKMFKSSFARDKTARVLTDVVGPYNTVVVEHEAKDLTDYENQMKEYSKMDPEMAKMMDGYTDMYLTGRREIFRVIE